MLREAASQYTKYSFGVCASPENIFLTKLVK